MPELAEWESFYGIVGSAVGTLIGLQFIVVTLMADKSSLRAEEAGAAFATPTIVHVSSVLLLSALLRAPWHAITPVAVLWGLMAVGGVVYAVIVARRMRVQTTYKPQFEDCLYYAVLPMAAYAMLALSAFAAPFFSREALFAVAAAALLLLFSAIHNTWDSVAYQVFVNRQSSKTEKQGDENSGTGKPYY
jgi:hypothetical protein